MTLPRDVSGEELASGLARYGYEVTRQTGSHMRLTSTFKGNAHHITIPRHNPLRVGTFSQILNEVCSYLEVQREDLIKKLFK